MIEIAFDESSAGALKYAKSMSRGEIIGGASAVFGGTAKQRREAKKPRVWSGAAIGGSSADVAELMLMLDIGDISDTASGMGKRKELLETLFSDFPRVSEAIWKASGAALERLEEAKASLEPVRMWVCEGNPAELCGMYFVCRLMAGARTPLSVVMAPDGTEKDGRVISLRGMGDIDAELIGEFICYERQLSEARRGVYADCWSALVHENAPLRAVVNGVVLSVPADFYDFALLANLPEGEFMAAQLIGRTLGKTRGVGDRLLYLRVREMLRLGRLVEVSAASEDHPYSGVLKRNETFGLTEKA